MKYAPDDQLFIFLAGHGTANEEFRDGYIIAKDSLKDDPNVSSYVSYSQLQQIIDQIPNHHILLVIDACFGGAFLNSQSKTRRHHSQYQDINDVEFIDQKMRIRTRRLITSGYKEVPDGRSGEHSPFASKFLGALETRGGTSRVLTTTTIASFLQRVNPTPVIGDWGENERDSEFLFISKK